MELEKLLIEVRNMKRIEFEKTINIPIFAALYRDKDKYVNDNDSEIGKGFRERKIAEINCKYNEYCNRTGLEQHKEIKSTSDEKIKCEEFNECPLRNLDPEVNGCWDKLCEKTHTNNKTIEELSMKLYSSSDLGEDIDHNVFTQIYQSGYKIAQQKSQADRSFFINRISKYLDHIKELECQITDQHDRYVDKVEELECKIDDVLLQENQSLKEQIKILAHITYTYNPDVDISKYLHNLSTEDYQLFIENNKIEDCKDKRIKKLECVLQECTDYLHGPGTGNYIGEGSRLHMDIDTVLSKKS